MSAPTDDDALPAEPAEPSAAAPNRLPHAPALWRRLRRRGPRDVPFAQSLWRINGVYWFIVAYCGLWILLRSYGFGGPPLPPVSRAAVGVVLALAAVNLYLRTKSVFKRGGYGQSHPDRYGWIFTVLDLSVVAAGLRLTGGIDSGLWPVLFVIIAAETVLEKPREAVLVQIGSALALTAAVVPVPLYFGPWALELATRFVFLLAVSIVTRRLRENADREKAEVAALRAELALSGERSKLSREIHDGVGNALAASVLRLEVTARTIEKQAAGAAAAATPAAQSGEAPSALLRDEAQALREAMNSVRDWTYFNKPWTVEGTAAASDADALAPSARLRAEIERLSRRTGLPITLDGEAEIDALSVPSRLALLRIVQEALTNAAKYAAGASRAEVHLRREGRWLALTIADDGCGFDPGATGTGLGMSSMRERAEGIGGALLVDSTPGLGTTVAARLPAA